MTALYPQFIFGDLCGYGIRKIPNPSLPYFSVRDFPLPRKELTWSSFPSSLHFQPEIITKLPHSTHSFHATPSSRSDSPNFDGWRHLLSLHNHPKTVLARKTTLSFESPIDPISIVQMLRSRAKNSLIFAVILAPHLAFLGATPELLFRRRGRKLYTEALAGTSTLGEEHKLLSSEKDLLEFSYVKEELAKKLSLIAKPFRVDDKIYIKKTSHVAHLHYPFEVELKRNVRDSDLIDLLHPTPAIGGFPKASALDFIYQHEPFDRGWYAGTIGTLTPSESEIYVGIRSAIIQENQMQLFAGAGIVNISLSNLEWQELENKIKLWM